MAFSATHVSHSGNFGLPISPEQAFSFFSPEGERSWVNGWTPEYLHPTSGELEPGLVFRTDADGEETLWLLVRYDVEILEAEYVRVTPNSRIGTVTIRCSSDGDGDTNVEVFYELTGLSETGNRTLSLMTAESYDSMLEEWRNRITAVLLDSVG